MLSGSGPTGSTLPRYHRWHPLYSFLLGKSSLHAVICKMGHAVLSYMTRSITPCTRAYAWVRNVTIWASAPGIPPYNWTLPNILGFTIGFFSAIPIIMVRIATNIAKHIHTLFFKDFSQVRLPNLLQGRQRPTSRHLIMNLQLFKLSLRFRKCPRAFPWVIALPVAC